MKTIKIFIFSLITIAFLNTSFLLGQRDPTGGVFFVKSSDYGSLNFDNSSAWNKVFITNRPTKTSFFTGSPYIKSEWQLADVIVTENKGVILNMPVRIDAEYNLVEILDDNRVKVLHATNTYSIAIKGSNEVFVSNKTLGISEPEGFFKVIYNKKSSLLCHYSTKLIEGSYNAVLDAGIKEDKTVIDKRYYILKDGKITKLEKNRKRLIRQFNEKPDVIKYIKEERIVPREESDLIRLMAFIDLPE